MIHVRRLVLVLVFGAAAGVASADLPGRVGPPGPPPAPRPPGNTLPVAVVLVDEPAPRLALPPAVYERVAPAAAVPNSRPAARPRLLVVEGMRLEVGDADRITLYLPRRRAAELAPVTIPR